MATDNIRGPLYELLLRKLPVCREGDGTLNIKRLHEGVGMSHEGVYKWLRANRISPGGVEKVIELGKRDDNVALLPRREKAPERSDFVAFLF